jgi:hypothetical protein
MARMANESDDPAGLYADPMLELGGLGPFRSLQSLQSKGKRDGGLHTLDWFCDRIGL